MMASFTPMSGGDFPDWDGGLDDIEAEGDLGGATPPEPEATAPTVEGIGGLGLYCLKPLDDHNGWSKGRWPYMQRKPMLICEKWVPSSDG